MASHAETGTRESSARVVQVCSDTESADRSSTDNVMAEEQFRMNDCYYAKKDWRACKEEVRELLASPTSSSFPSTSQTSATDVWQRRLTSLQMEVFRKCWKRNGNHARTGTKDA
jgi:hypothetical protein